MWLAPVRHNMPHVTVLPNQKSQDLGCAGKAGLMFLSVCQACNPDSLRAYLPGPTVNTIPALTQIHSLFFFQLSRVSSLTSSGKHDVCLRWHWWRARQGKVVLPSPRVTSNSPGCPAGLTGRNKKNKHSDECRLECLKHGSQRVLQGCGGKTRCRKEPRRSR